MGVQMGPNGQVVVTDDNQPGVIDEKRFRDIEQVQENFGDGLINTPAGQRGNFFSLDPGGMFGTRQAEIERIAGEGYKGGRFQLDHNAKMLGITEQDVANYYMTEYQSQRKGTEAGKYGLTNFPEGQKPNAATSQLQLTKEVGDRKAGTALREGIRAIDGGTTLLQTERERLGRNLTNTELESLTTKASGQTREALAGREQATAELDRTKQLTQASKDTVDINRDKLGIEQGQLNLNSRIAHNTQVINSRNADIATINANNQRIQLENSERNSQADRDLRRDMAMLTREDNREGRRYDRERDERKDRQLIILQLMKGLSSLGGNISI